jgi:ketosteroid isomerase-like protein
MKKSILISTLFVVFLFVSVLNSQCQSVKEIKAKLEKMNAEMVDAMIKGENEKSLTYYADDAVSLPSYQPLLVGIEAIKKSSEAMTSSGVKINSFEVSIEKLIMDGDLIVEIGTYKMSMGMPNMDEPYEDTGKYLTVWEKQKDGSLKIKADTWNSDINPWMQGGGM